MKVEGRAVITVKIRITSDNAEDAENIRIHLERKLPGLKLGKARQGNNPKYAADPKFLAYGTLTLTRKPRKSKPKANEQLTYQIDAPRRKGTKS
jgi:hypothetical protein